MIPSNYPCSKCEDCKELCKDCQDKATCEGTNYCRACNCIELEDYEMRENDN